MPSGVVTLNAAQYLLVNDDDGDAQAGGVRGSEKKQDLTPSTHDQVQGIPGDTAIATGSVTVYGDATGSQGLLDRLVAPGDVSRPFLSELDNTRPRQMTAWLGSPTPVAFGTRNLAAAPDLFITLLDAAAGFGFIAKSASGTYDLWQWTGSAYAFLRAGYTRPAIQLLGYTSRQTYGTFRLVPQIATDYAGGLWYAANDGAGSSGLVNASVAPVAPVGDANAAATLVYLDMLWSFGLTASGVTITPYRFASGSTPATAGAQLQKIDMVPGSATYGTAINTTVTIPGEYAINGVVASESNVFLVTDHSLYRIGWNDGPNTFEFTRLPVEVPAFTSNPCSWNGEVWIGAGNQIVHLVPGQRTYDTVVVDDFGNSPSPFSGRVALLYASYGHLCAQLIDDQATTPSNAALMVRNTDGAWYDFAYCQTDIWAARMPMLKGLGANGFSLATVTSASTTTIYPLPASGKNPRNLPVAQRGQRGVERLMWPWEYGEDEASLKQLLRARLQVVGVGAQSATTHIRAFWQPDFLDQTTDSWHLSDGSFGAVTFPGIAKGQGAWTPIIDAYQGAVGDYTSTISGAGNGYLYTELDGQDAILVPTIALGNVTAVTVLSGGSGYLDAHPPSVVFQPLTGFAGAGATATATVVGGAVTAVSVTGAGAGYTNAGLMVVTNGGKGTPFVASGSSFSTHGGGYPYFHRIRWMVEIGGDTTGTIVPTMIALMYEFWEYPKVGYQYAIALRMRVGDTQILNGTKGDGTTRSKYNAAADIVADRDALEALKNNRTIVPYTGLDGHTINVLVTKISHDTLSVDSTGMQESVTDLVLQVAPLQGTV